MVRGRVATAKEDRSLSLAEIDDGWPEPEIPRSKPSGIRVVPPPLPSAADDEEYEVVDTFEEVIPFPFSWPMPGDSERTAVPKAEPRSDAHGPFVWTFVRTLCFFGAALVRRAGGYLKSEWDNASARAHGR